MIHRHAAIALVLPFALWGAAAQATTINLSQYSSECKFGEPCLIAANNLSAQLNFSVMGTTLTLSVENLTHLSLGGGGDYWINEIYFNATDDVSGLTLASPGDWTLGTMQPADGFGVFDYGLFANNNDAQIAAGDTQLFTFDIDCVMGGTCDASAFGTTFSTNPPGDIAALAAAKFVRGPGDASAYGATGEAGHPPQVIPVPAAVWLLGSGLLGLVAMARRRRV